MIRNISEDIKREVLNKYMYTKMTIKKIAKLNNLSYGEVISILEEYESIHGHIERNFIEIEPEIKLADKKEQRLEERNQIIYNLRKQNLSYSAISEQLEKQGIKASIYVVRKVCKEIFDLQGETEPKSKRVKSNKSNKKIDESEEVNKKIYELREKGLTYRKIVKELELQGIKLSVETVRKRCKGIYELKGKPEPELRKKEIDKDHIYILRQQGLSYSAISEELEKQGITVSSDTIRTICKDIYISKGQTEPKVGNSKKRIKESQDINKKIYELREKRLSYSEIAKELELQGIKISSMAISKRCKKIYELKGKTEPELLKREVDNEQIYILRQQGLSYSSIEKELKKQGVKITNTTIRRICKEIYTLKGEVEPLLIRQT